MAYSLESEMKIENNKKLRQCLDEKYYKWNKIVSKHSSWYEEDVHEYI